MSQIDNPYAATASSVSSGSYGAEVADSLATRLERFAGALIDGLIMLAVVFPLGFAVGLAVAATMGNGGVAPFVAQVLGGILGILAFLAIQGYFLANRSQTIGKIAMNTKIVSENGQPLTFTDVYVKRYLVLQLVSLIPYIGGLIGLVDALCIFRGNVKCLHDDIAGTKVIKLR